jgi:hypothetical protein
VCEKLDSGATALARMCDGVRARRVGDVGMGARWTRNGQSRIVLDWHEPSFRENVRGSAQSRIMLWWTLSVVRWWEVVAVMIALPKIAVVVLEAEVERGRGSSLAATAARGLPCETVRSSHSGQVKGKMGGARAALG